MAEADRFVDAIKAVARNGWTGTAGELLALLPGDVRPAAANKLAGRLNETEAALSAKGVMLQMRREAGSGRRLMTLSMRCDDTTARQVAEEGQDFPPPVARPRPREGAGRSCISHGERLPPGSWCTRCGGQEWWSRGESLAWACMKCCPDVLAGFGGQAPPHRVTT